MTDDEIIAIRKRPRFATAPTKPWGDSIAFARAVLVEKEAKKSAARQRAAELRLAHESELRRINEVHERAYFVYGRYLLTDKEEFKEESDRLFAKVKTDLAALRTKVLATQ